MEISTKEEVLQLIIKEAPVYALAYNNGEHKKANKVHGRIVTAMDFLIKNDALYINRIG